VSALLRAGADRLRAVGVESARLDAEVLLAFALGVDRTRLLASLNDAPGVGTVKNFEALLSRRLEREPVAYITGVREFYGLTFEVNPDTLVPRPETELLVELALKSASCTGGSAADVGAGSGCIAIAFAVHAPHFTVHASDVSAPALDTARRNAALHGVSDRVCFHLGDLLAGLPSPLKIVTANLPYVRTDGIRGLQPEVSHWEPHVALDGGPDGLVLVRRLLAQLPGKAASDAVCLLELDPRQFAPLRAELPTLLPGWELETQRDLAGLDRIALLRSPS